MNHMPFQSGGARNFLGLSNHLSQPFVVVGAPVDCATTFRSGSRMEPNAIRDASMMLIDGVNEAYPVDLRLYVGDAGDMALPSGYNDIAMSTIEQDILSFGQTHVVTLGGHHGITDAILRAHSHRHNNIAVVHFDAHCDTWEGHFGMPCGHGTWLYNSVEGQSINPTKTISIGIRSPADQGSREFLEKNGGQTVSARVAMKTDPIVMAQRIKTVVGDTPCYLTLDIDCLDPAYAPGTGTPEIGGLSTIWLGEVIEHLDDINWIGMDCVEVAPAYDNSQITALAASTFVWQYLSMNASKLAAQ